MNLNKSLLKGEHKEILNELGIKDDELSSLEQHNII